MRLSRSDFWTGLGGLSVTVLIALVVVALLVGWVLAWANQEEGPNALWLTLGSIAFVAVLTLLGMLLLSLRTSNRLRQAEAAFLTGASHNLRTPLSAIRAAAQTVKQASSLSPDDRARLLEAILHETSRLELRVDNLLETARLDLERRPFTRSTIALGELAASVLDDARWAFAARRGRSEMTCAAEPLSVDGDERALRLLLENLVDNALKYADGPPRVRVTVTRSADHAVVRVIDAGIGFASSGANEELFRRFRRGDTGRPGSGLGLALGRAIARGHGGALILKSDGPGLGATAEVWLPLHPQASGQR